MNKLEEIEKNGVDTELPESWDDIQWLINRVKKLEEALANLVKSDIIQTAQYITYSEAYLNARKVLED